jgi:HEAT repeat protein
MSFRKLQHLARLSRLRSKPFDEAATSPLPGEESTMRWASVVFAIAVLPLFGLAQPPQALDWKSFDDPNALLLTDSFAKSIGDLPAPEKATALKRLHQSLLSREVEVRRRAALTLGRLGDWSGVPVMVADLSKATGRDRDNVIVALRILKDERAIPALRAALKDKSPMCGASLWPRWAN